MEIYGDHLFIYLFAGPRPTVIPETWMKIAEESRVWGMLVLEISRDWQILLLLNNLILRYIIVFIVVISTC